MAQLVARPHVVGETGVRFLLAPLVGGRHLRVAVVFVGMAPECLVVARRLMPGGWQEVMAALRNLAISLIRLLHGSGVSITTSSLTRDPKRVIRSLIHWVGGSSVAACEDGVS